jgi:predicted Zn-dependent protease
MQEVNRVRVVALASLVLAGCTAPGQKPGEAGTSTSSFSLSRGFSSPRDSKPIIADLKSGRYEASSLAVGQQKDLARQRGEGLGFVPSPALESYLNSIRGKLVLASGVTDVPGKVVIIASRELAAYSTPDGNVYLAVAWLDDLETEDELGAIIAHEQSHVLLKHHSADIMAGVQKRAQAVQELAVSTKTQLEKAPVVAKSDQRGLANTQMLVEASDKVIMPAWGRNQEREADLLGVDLLVRAGYSPIAMTSMLERLQAWEKKTQKSEEAFWQRANEAAKQNAAQAVGMALKGMLDSLSTSHPDTGKRLEDIASYIDRHHSDIKLPKPKKLEWENVKKRPEVKEVMRNYDLAFTARKLFDQGKPSEAYSPAKSSATGRTAAHAYPNWILSKAAMATGRGNEAVAALDRAIKSNEPIRKVYDEIILVNEQRGNLDVALGWTDKAAAAFGDADFWVPDKIRLLRKVGRVAEASALTVKCTLDTPDSRKRCQEANQTPAPAAKR